MTVFGINQMTPATTGYSGYRDGPSMGGLMATMAKYGCVFAPPNDEGVDDDAAKAAAAAAADEKAKAEAEAAKKAEEDKRARRTQAEIEADRLKAQLAETQEKLKLFDGATPDEIKALREAKAKADAAAKKAEEDKREAEKKRLQEAGDFEGLKRKMAEEHQADMDRLAATITELQGQQKQLQSKLVGVQVSSNFAGSKYLAEETILTPVKAMKLFGDHFEVTENGLMAYDAPPEVTGRKPFVDGRGRALSFDEAIKRIVEADPDAERLIRSKMKPGSGQKPVKGNMPSEERQPTGLERIAAGLANLGKK